MKANTSDEFLRVWLKMLKSPVEEAVEMLSMIESMCLLSPEACLILKSCWRGTIGNWVWIGLLQFKAVSCSAATWYRVEVQGNTSSVTPLGGRSSVIEPLRVDRHLSGLSVSIENHRAKVKYYWFHFDQSSLLQTRSNSVLIRIVLLPGWFGFDSKFYIL